MMRFGSWAYHHIQDNTPKVESFFKPRQLYNLAVTGEVAAAAQNESKLPRHVFAKCRVDDSTNK
jgi:hypothetical protein